MYIILKRSGGDIQTDMKRKHFIGQLLGITGITILLNACRHQIKQWQIHISGANAALGHQLRDGAEIPAPVETLYDEVVIVGGGISGLSAARYLSAHGITKIRLLELAKEIGGNAKSDANEVSAYPCGAHYVPIPNNNLTEYLSFLEEAGVMTGYNQEGLPVYNEHYLCFDPEERLFINGSWQEGLVPHFGVADNERKQISRFLQQMDLYRYSKGKDGADAFNIPVDQSSKDPVFTRLDSLTMYAWLSEQGYNSEYLRNYINYCCKDDYGTDIYSVSAWAGIHYFASRKGKGGNAGHADVLTWPEGNAFLAKHLAIKTAATIQTSCLVNRIEIKGEKVWIDYHDAAEAKQKRSIARHCILAVPQYIVSRLLNDADRKQKTTQYLHYVPWIVANLRVRTMPEQHGIGTCWDNVLYNGTGLGYVDATHQLIKQHHSQKNFTYYLPLTNQQPEKARKWARDRTKEEWQDQILADMKKMYPDIEQYLEEINISIWGHAMAQPKPGLIFGKERQLLKESGSTRIHLAHTDLAGISIFEEAFYQGIHAARAIIQQTEKKG